MVRAEPSLETVIHEEQGVASPWMFFFSPSRDRIYQKVPDGEQWHVFTRANRRGWRCREPLFRKIRVLVPTLPYDYVRCTVNSHGRTGNGYHLTGWSPILAPRDYPMPVSFLNFFTIKKENRFLEK